MDGCVPFRCVGEAADPGEHQPVIMFSVPPVSATRCTIQSAVINHSASSETFKIKLAGRLFGFFRTQTVNLEFSRFRDYLSKQSDGTGGRAAPP